MNSVGIIVITKSPAFLNSVVNALQNLIGDTIVKVAVATDFPAPPLTVIENLEYEKVKRTAQGFLAQQKTPISIQIIHSRTFEGVFQKQESWSNVISMTFLDLSASDLKSHYPSCIQESLNDFYQSLAEQGISTQRTLYSDVVYYPKLSIEDEIFYSPPYITRVIPDEPWVFAADVVCLCMDLFQGLFVNRRSQKLLKDQPPVITLADELAKFLTDKVGSNWQFSYYTGSVISSFINHLEATLGKSDILRLRGPSEHSLACGAIANWQLYQRHFLIAVTSGMMDEFKGTLANLRATGAKGFIVCAENPPEQWFAFQGTINRDEDIREVLKAKKIPTLFLQDPQTLAEDLEKAFHIYNSEPGPVVILATQQVLESTTPIAKKIPYLQKNSSSDTTLSDKKHTQLNEVLEIINHEPSRLLWQVGHLEQEEEKLLLSIIERAGIALVDSLARPGTVSKYMNGRLVRNYLGTLGVYGYTPSVYSFLHRKGELNPKDSQCLFFLKSRIGQVSTPFSRIVLQNKLRLVQVTQNSEHLAPFVEYPLAMPLIEFLQYIDQHLDVNPLVLELRQQAIQQALNSQSEVICEIPILPMSPNYFTSQLNLLIEELIQQEDYQYTGLYDVGRCGISAIRNIVRTGLGFSGWYGRALMGDALLSTLAVAPTATNNVLAFVGDGAKLLVPDVLPYFIEAAMTMPEKFQKNVSIFYFMNGGHSMINSYQSFLARSGDRQMRITNIVEPNWQKTYGSLQVHHYQLEKFDRSLMRSALLASNRLNLFSVFVNHNNQGDGLSLLASQSWQFA